MAAKNVAARSAACAYVCMYVIENEDYCCCCLFVSTRKYFILMYVCMYVIENEDYCCCCQSFNQSIFVCSLSHAQNKIDNNESIKGKKLSTECLK